MICLHGCLCEGIRRLGTGIPDSCELPYGCQELNPGSLEQQPEPLTAKPSLQLPEILSRKTRWREITKDTQHCPLTSTCALRQAHTHTNNELIYFKNVSVWVFLLKICLCTMCAPGARGDQKRMIGPLGLEPPSGFWN